MGRLTACLGLAAVALAAQASGASATDFYVNGTTGSNSNNCLQPTVGGAGVGPCLTIAGAMSLAEDNNGNRVLIADGTYSETLTGANAVASAMTLSSSDGGVNPKPVINGQVEIDSTGGSIDHLELKAASGPVLQIAGPGTIADNAFTAMSLPDLSTDIEVQSGTGNLTIERNTFSDDGAGQQIAIRKNASTLAVSILDNTISGLWRGIFVVNDSAPVIRRNTISGSHNSGAGITLYGGLGAELTANRIFSPASVDDAFGITISNTTAPVSATLSRNQVIGAFSTGIDVYQTNSVTLDSDLVAGAFSFGLNTFDDIGPGSADVTATNATIFGSGNSDIITDNALVTLNSSIVGDVFVSGSGTCAISFSRGDVAGGTPMDTSNCDDFQTAANPLFVDPTAPIYDFHLMGASPMIDAGSPSPPLPGALDVFGNPRAALTPSCTGATLRRDMGAAEFTGFTALTCPAAATPDAGSTTQPAAKKCKKKRKRHAAAAKKKCRRKKK